MYLNPGMNAIKKIQKFLKRSQSFIFMALFWKKKDKEIVDLTESGDNEDPYSGRKAGLFDNLNVSGNSRETGEERRKKLAKRIADITDKLDGLGNQIYLLQQRIEVLERKLNINKDLSD